MGAFSRSQIGEGGAENNRFASKAPNALTFFLSDGFIEKVRLLVRPSTNMLKMYRFLLCSFRSDADNRRALRSLVRTPSLPGTMKTPGEVEANTSLRQRFGNWKANVWARVPPASSARRRWPANQDRPRRRRTPPGSIRSSAGSRF